MRPTFCPTVLLPALLAGCVPVLTSPDGPELCGEEAYVAPENAWTVGEVPADLCGEGWGEGETVEDARWTDQNGQEVSMWQFYGNVVLLDLSTLWCAPCKDLAAEVQATADDYRDEGFVYMTILVEDLEADVPDQEELQEWGTYFGIAEPIVSDTANVAPTLLPESNYPGVFLISRDMVNLGRIDPADDPTIRAAVEAEL